MSDKTMLEVALECIRRGWATFPCTPGTKKPRIPTKEGGHGYKDATLDEAQVRAWWAKWPTANVPVATGASRLFVLDIDAGIRDEAHLIEWMTAHNMPKTFAVRSGSRPAFKVHLYYSQPEADLASINGWELDGCSGDIRCSTGLVIAPGGQHKSGTPYGVLWDIPLEATPESAKALTERANLGTPTEVDAETAEKWKNFLWDYIGRNDLDVTGFEAPMPDGWKIGITCPWATSHTTGQGNNSTVLCIRAPGKVVFICSHGSCGRAGHNTAAFKQLMKQLHNEDTPEPGADLIPVLGTGTKIEATPDEYEPEVVRVHPDYPNSVWDGTPYGDFAAYCCKGNFIRPRFFLEAIRTVVGAVVGEQLTSDSQGVCARLFTVLIGPPGSGKGTAITAAHVAIQAPVDSQARSNDGPLLWPDMQDHDHWCWPSRSIGALVMSPASAPGLINATLPHKLTKKETRNPMELWHPLPRFITIQEEIGGLFANFANENSGAGLEAAILELYDRNSFTTTVTNDRPSKSGRLVYSILGGIPKTEWDKIFERASSVGSGLFSRLNIIGTESDKTVAKIGKYDFSEFQRMFLPRITALEKSPQHIPISAKGTALLDDWFKRVSLEMKLKDVPTARLNIHAQRVALHLAWLKGHKELTEEDIEGGIQVADFQAKMRDFYRPAEGESRDAVWEGKILKYMTDHKSVGYREIQRALHAYQAGTAVWGRAIQGLVRDGKIAMVDQPANGGQTKKMVKLLKLKVCDTL